MVCHDWANRLTGGKKEIGDIYFVLIKILSDAVTVLIDELKIGNSMVFFLMLNCAVDQFKINLRRLIYREDFCGFKDGVKGSHDNDRKQQHSTDKEFVFFSVLRMN